MLHALLHVMLQGVSQPLFIFNKGLLAFLIQNGGHSNSEIELDLLIIYSVSSNILGKNNLLWQHNHVDTP